LNGAAPGDFLMFCIDRFFFRFPVAGSQMLIENIKAYVYTFSRMLNTQPEKVSGLIGLIEQVHYMIFA
jgi:hypothetical protein